MRIISLLPFFRSLIRFFFRSFFLSLALIHSLTHSLTHSLSLSLFLSLSSALSLSLSQRLLFAVSGSCSQQVTEDQQCFLVADKVYVGSEYAAADVGLLRGLDVSRVINVSAGSRKVPNFGAAVPDWEVQYVNIELLDQMGENTEKILSAMHDSAAKLQTWSDEGRSVLVHCSAGLCRSATMVLAWLMQHRRLSLSAAVTHFRETRGRLPQPSASYWSALVRFERTLTGAPNTTPPSFDFSDWVLEDCGCTTTGLQLGPDDVLAARLRECQWDAAAMIESFWQ